jgi:hypothetical protein
MIFQRQCNPPEFDGDAGQNPLGPAYGLCTIRRKPISPTVTHQGRYDSAGPIELAAMRSYYRRCPRCQGPLLGGDGCLLCGPDW